MNSLLYLICSRYRNFSWQCHQSWRKCAIPTICSDSVDYLNMSRHYNNYVHPLVLRQFLVFGAIPDLDDAPLCTVLIIWYNSDLFSVGD